MIIVHSKIIVNEKCCISCVFDKSSKSHKKTFILLRTKYSDIVLKEEEYT